MLATAISQSLTQSVRVPTRHADLVCPIIVLTLLNLVAHFLPFERAALHPDDYFYMLRIQNMPALEMMVTALVSPDRPLQNLSYFLQAKLIEHNVKIGLFLVLFSSSVLIAAVYYLFLELFRHAPLAFFSAVFYLLLPNKLELYHTSLYFGINLPFALYVLSFALFVRFMRVARKSVLFLSITSYTLAVFWYEVGIFLPLVLFAYAMGFGRDKKTSVLYFLVPLFMYGLFRMTDAFGLYHIQSTLPDISVGWFGPMTLTDIFQRIFAEIPNHYVGRHMVRAIAYGIYKFFSFELPWLIFIILLDVIILYALVVWIKKRGVPVIDVKMMYIAAIMFVIFLIPNIFVIVAGRHTALSSVGFTILCIGAISYFHRHWKAIGVPVLLFSLIVSQGNAWIQVIASRINNALYESIGEQKAEILKSERVLIDARSFADRIPYTWGEKQGNVLYSYYGMQALAPWGLVAMVPLIVGEKKTVYVSRSRLEMSDARLIFQVQDLPHHRMESIPKEGTVIIDYESVYGDHFRNGNRIRRTLPLRRITAERGSDPTLTK